MKNTRNKFMTISSVECSSINSCESCESICVGKFHRGKYRNIRD